MSEAVKIVDVTDYSALEVSVPLISNIKQVVVVWPDGSRVTVERPEYSVGGCTYCRKPCAGKWCPTCWAMLGGTT